MSTPHPADTMDWCPVCEAPATVEDSSTEQIGYEDKATAVAVIWLSCGHQITNYIKNARFIA